MPSSIDDQVLDFYGELFERLFSEPFRKILTADRRRLNVVIRQVEDASDAASSSLTRFFQNQKLGVDIVEEMLTGFKPMGELLSLSGISNPNVTTEEVVEGLLESLPYPQTVHQTNEAVYRLALYTVVQVLMQVGPVMAEWQKLNFSGTFELPRRVVNRLNEISEQINALGQSGQTGADESYEIMHRDYLLQRFHKVEAGTVRMTTSLDVDLRELFIMPHVAVRERIEPEDTSIIDYELCLMDLSAARKLYGDQNRNSRFFESKKKKPNKENTIDSFPTVLQQIKKTPFNVIVGMPGSGKSTFFEWLQVKLASVEEQFIIGGQQAIPLILKVRQLDLLNLPQGAALIEKATASKDRANVMPDGWIDRQMKAGRILLMLDGLDETEPELRDKYLLPWLQNLLQEYPKCHYLISSRTVGYPTGLLDENKFVECDLLDFDKTQISEYTCHWCISVRLAQNELEEEARREGQQDGLKIVQGFQKHPYISNLARNPLMLSAICLVNYFEGGRLPEDRSLLYRLCVEGLLHNWDQRRGIHSEFGFDEKLRCCREVALAMQMEDKAEFESDQVKEVFTKVLGDPERASALLEHIRYRTGLLLERRPDIFGFAHLTFQEYLAARAIHEGNRIGFKAEQLALEHDDGRWKEVIALYCGLATTPAAKELIEHLIAQPDTESLSEVLTEAYMSAGSETSQDQFIRQNVLERVAIAPRSRPSRKLSRFSIQEASDISNKFVGRIQSNFLSESYSWLLTYPQHLENMQLLERLKNWQNMTPNQISELVYLTHSFAPNEILDEIARLPNLYSSSGAYFINHKGYFYQAEIALLGLVNRVHYHCGWSQIAFHKVVLTFLVSDKFSRNPLDSFSFTLDKKFYRTINDQFDFNDKRAFMIDFENLLSHLEKTIANYDIEEVECSLSRYRKFADSIRMIS
jgi:energy-coupling factor transporter ATP-binding protein EcfA2